MATPPVRAAADHSPPVQALTCSYQSGTAPPPATVSTVRTVTVRRKARFASHSVDASAVSARAAIGNVPVPGRRVSSAVSEPRPARVSPAPAANSQFASCQVPRCCPMRVTALTPRAVHTGYSAGRNAATNTAVPPVVSSTPISVRSRRMWTSLKSERVSRQAAAAVHRGQWAGGPPVPPPEQPHGRRYQQGPHQGGVHGNGGDHAYSDQLGEDEVA